MRINYKSGYQRSNSIQNGNKIKLTRTKTYKKKNTDYFKEIYRIWRIIQIRKGDIINQVNRIEKNDYNKDKMI